MTAGPATDGADGGSPWSSGHAPGSESLEACDYQIRVASRALAAADRAGAVVVAGKLRERLASLQKVRRGHVRGAEAAYLRTLWVRSGPPRAVPEWPTGQASGAAASDGAS